MPRGLLVSVAAAVAFAISPAAQARSVELVAELDGPSLARATAASCALSPRAKQRRLALAAPTARAYLVALERAQRGLERRLHTAIPRARVRWRYSVVLNALAVTLPEADVPRLQRLPGVRRVHGAVRYRARLDRSVGRIGAQALWGTDLSLAGGGVKIGILDEGVDPNHPFFNPRGFAFPPGYPKGQRDFTTGKIIVARAFPPARPRWRHASKPFDPEHSSHGTHVAGIAGGNSGVFARASRANIAGVAPRAYIGNYKVLTIPTESGVGLDGNSPQIVAGIEAAVRDGMDVINLSLGEPEIEPSRDIVARALDGAAAAGVVPVVAAGNEFANFGRGSVWSPASAKDAITVAAAGDSREIASFSSAGPTPLSLRLKPDVTAPGTGILSATPERLGLWDEASGTSMSAPHVAGAAALLLQRNPSWTPAQVKAALMLTADPLRDAALPPTRQGSGLVNLQRATTPLLFAQPSSVSFGLIRRGQRVARAIELSDAGGGAGTWSIALERQGPADVVPQVPASVTVPGRLELAATASASAAEGEASGFVRLARGSEVRRIPYWLRISVATLSGHRVTRISRTGTYRGNTAGRPSLADTYRYPDRLGPEAPQLNGPEQVFRVRLTRPVANFGVAVVSRAAGVNVTPRIVAAGDEDRLMGSAALPYNLNPYLTTFMSPRAVAGVLQPVPGEYDIVFDTPDMAAAGRYSFRFWIDDRTPPRLRLRARTVRAGAALPVGVAEGGAGIDHASTVVRINGRKAAYRFARGRLLVSTDGLERGRHTLFLQVSDRQETRNMENVPRILPNTGQLAASFVVR